MDTHEILWIYVQRIRRRNFTSDEEYVKPVKPFFVAFALRTSQSHLVIFHYSPFGRYVLLINSFYSTYNFIVSSNIPLITASLTPTLSAPLAPPQNPLRQIIHNNTNPFSPHPRFASLQLPLRECNPRCWRKYQCGHGYLECVSSTCGLSRWWIRRVCNV